VVDGDVNLPEERRPRRSTFYKIFAFRDLLDNEINLIRWLTGISTFRVQDKARQETGLMLNLDLLYTIVYFSAVMRKKRLEPSSDRFRLICLLLAGTIS